MTIGSPLDVARRAAAQEAFDTWEHIGTYSSLGEWLRKDNELHRVCKGTDGVDTLFIVKFFDGTAAIATVMDPNIRPAIAPMKQ